MGEAGAGAGEDAAEDAAQFERLRYSPARRGGFSDDFLAHLDEVEAEARGAPVG